MTQPITDEMTAAAVRETLERIVRAHQDSDLAGLKEAVDVAQGLLYLDKFGLLDKVDGYRAIVARQQQEIATLKAQNEAILGVFECEWSPEVVQDFTDDFTQGRAEIGLFRIVNGLKLWAHRRCRSVKLRAQNSCADAIILLQSSGNQSRLIPTQEG